MKLTEFAVIASIIGAATVESVKLDIENIDPQVHNDNHSAIRNLQEYSVTGQSSIVFKGCANLAVEAYGQSDTVQGFINNGMATGVKSYVEFDVCDTDSCWSGNEARQSYVVDLADYINAFGSFLPTKQEAYCEACLNYIDYCQLEYTTYEQVNEQQQQKKQAYQEWIQYWSDENTQQRQQGAQQQNGGQRRRRMENQVVYEEIDCNRCTMYDCLAQQSDWNSQYYHTSYQWRQENSLNFIQNMASCYRDDQNPIMIEDTQGSFGFICNAAGTGVEIGVFLDEDCTIFANQLPFGSIMSGQEHYFWQQTKSSIEYIFDTSFSCYDPDVQYVSADEMANYAQSGSYEDSTGDTTEAGEWCAGVFEGDVAPVAMADCNSTFVTMGTNFTLSQEDADDPYAACSALVANDGLGDMVYPANYSASMYRYSNQGLYGQTSYNGNTSGDRDQGSNFWSRWFGGLSSSTGSSSNSISSSSNWQNDLDSIQLSNNGKSSQYFSGKSSDDLSGVVIALIVVAIIAIVIAGGAGCTKWYKNSKFAMDKKEPMLNDTIDDDNNPGWTMVGRIA